MKGPGLRVNLDVRRLWRCPRCGRVARTPGAVTAVRCGCSDETWMQLQPPVKREPFRPPPRTPEQIAEDRADEPDEDDIPLEPDVAARSKPDAPMVSDPPEPAASTVAPVEPANRSSSAPESAGVAPAGSEAEHDQFGEGIPPTAATE